MRRKETSLWLHCALPCPNRNTHRLILFPHAGGVASFFRHWPAELKDYEVYIVRYPGRGERIDEPLFSDLLRLAFEIAEAIAPLSGVPISLFGHSMGAVVALETTRALEARNISIAHLFASGSRNGPYPPVTEYFEEDDDTVCEQLVSMGGTSSEIASDPIFRELILPAIRADGKMFHSYKMKTEPLLRCPVTTIVGDNDEHADVRPWSRIAPTCFKEEKVSGDHFYLVSNPPFLLLRKNLNANALKN